MGELRGRGDQPPEQPDNPADAEQSWNTTKEGDKRWRVIRTSDDMFAPPSESRPDKSRLEYEKPSPDDRPAERPPSGEELVETDDPYASRLDKLHDQILEKDFLEDALDSAEHSGRDSLNIMPSDRPNAKAEVCVRLPDKAHWTPGPGVDGGEVFTGMLVAGIAIGEGAMKAHRMRNEWKERRDGRFG